MTPQPTLYQHLATRIARHHLTPPEPNAVATLAGALRRLIQRPAVFTAAKDAKHAKDVKAERVLTGLRPCQAKQAPRHG